MYDHSLVDSANAKQLLVYPFFHDVRATFRILLVMQDVNRFDYYC